MSSSETKYKTRHQMLVSKFQVQIQELLTRTSYRVDMLQTEHLYSQLKQASVG